MKTAHERSAPTAQIERHDQFHRQTFAPCPQNEESRR